MVEMLLGGEALQHWCQFKSQVTGLPILGVLGGNDKESSREDEYDKEKRKKKKDKRQSSTSVGTPVGITKDTHSASMHKFMCYYFVNHQIAVRSQKHYLQNYLQKPKDLEFGTWWLDYRKSTVCCCIFLNL
eukprot:7957680-Ditylum_brightwellii.AAC.1